ncbi:hypothetical protein JCM3774_001652 [Rhodotorula dairenensis]
MATQLALAGLSYLPGGGLLLSTVNTASSTTTSVLKAAWRTRTSTETTKRTSSASFFARSPSLGVDDSVDSTSSALPPFTPPASATSPPLRPLMLSTLRQNNRSPLVHGHPHHQHRSSASMGADVMMLGTTCSGCGSHVAVQVPPWMLSAMEASQQRHTDHYTAWHDDVDPHPYLAPPSGQPGAGFGARAPRLDGQPHRRARQVDWRGAVVHTAIGTARAIKASPIPGLILTFFRAMFAFVLLLDARFSLHQRAAIILSRFLEGLVEIEKEVGVMRGAGEALSIGWEATVKGIIAFAKADTSTNVYSRYDQPRKSSQPTTSIFTRQQQQPAPPSHPGSREQATSYFPPYQDTRAQARPADPGSLFGMPDYQRHVLSDRAGGGILVDSEEDSQLSSSSPRLGVDLDYSHETSCPPSPPHPSASSHAQPELAHPRPLRRTPMSSPALQSAYLAQSGHGGRNPAGLPTSASATFMTSSGSSSSGATATATAAYPFSAATSSTAETLLPPYDIAAHSAVASGRAGEGAGSKAYPRRSAAAASSHHDGRVPDLDGGGGGNALHLRHGRSRSGPDASGGGSGGLYLEPGGEGLAGVTAGGGGMPAPPPPSPVGSRAGWAGKAMLGLAERMKVI